MRTIKNISIIGRGDFGKLVADLIPRGSAHTNYGSKDTLENLDTIVRSDVIVLSVPLQAYENLLPKLAPLLKPETLVVDVCSVKVKPAEIIAKLLPNHTNVLLTHPLFGPQSIHNGKKHTLVVTNGTTDEKALGILEYCANKLKLEVLHMSNEEHDKRMADIHVLTFFIARALGKMDLHAEPFMTPSFQELLDLVALDSSHTEALFDTIQNGNPYGAAERQRLISLLSEIDESLTSS